MIATVIAALALLVGALTLQDQQQINEVTRERAERRYVERVAWWIEETGKSHVIHIQNRSPVRLLDVEALYRPIDTADDRLGVAQFEQMIMPCTMVGYELVLLEGDHRDEKIWPVAGEGADARFLVNDLPAGWTLRLHDSYGGWDFPFDGSPRPISDNRTPFRIYRSALLQKPKYQREIADCSEGG
ncbi:hypothetical protein [Micromonospora sp. NPDC005367]|uniref:hypothetical protein n=1 Tax=Micromonospora sp. NPDC005367 TaxID=3155590 RepID=UPI0033B75272